MRLADLSVRRVDDGYPHGMIVGIDAGRTSAALTGLVAVGLTASLLATATPADGATCSQQNVQVGIVKAIGCFNPDSGDPKTLVSSGEFTMNGFRVKPDAGSSVRFTPPNGNRAGSVTTGGGRVTLSAQNATFGPVTFASQAFSVTPPASGDMVLFDSALAQPLPLISTFTPLGVSQPVRLTEAGAEFDLSFALGGFFGKFLTKSGATLAGTLGFAVKDGSFAVAGGKLGVSDFEIANLFSVSDANVQFKSQKDFSVAFDAAFTALNKRYPTDKSTGPSITGGLGISNGNMSEATLGFSVPKGIQLGTSGVFMRKFVGSIFPAVPSGGRALVGLTAGPEVDFFKKPVTALELDGSLEVRGADPDKKAPAFIKASGDLRALSLPVANAFFTYFIGQGTDFGTSFGIGLPSGTNDPGQPTYIGGDFRGWTSARNFSLEGRAALKAIGINLLAVGSVLSDVGLAACVDSFLGAIGGGVVWGKPPRWVFMTGNTCDFGPFRRARPSAQAFAAGSRATTVELGPRHQIVRVLAPDGEDAPDLTLRGDDGESLATPPDDDADGIVTTDDGVALRSDNATVFVLPPDSGGEWTVRRRGDDQVDRVLIGRMLPDHRLRAYVTGSGATRTLHWRARDIPGQHLEFTERLPNGLEVPILRTAKARGQHRFRPAGGPGAYGAGRRLMADVLMRAGSPRDDDLVLDRYPVRRLERPAAVRSMRVHREIEDVVVRWGRAVGAGQYEIVARPSGQQYRYRKVVMGDRRRTRLSVGASQRLVVSIRALNREGRPGPATRQVLRTDRLVPDARTATRRLLRSADVVAGSLVVHAACPDGAACNDVVVVRRAGREVGRLSFGVPADMTDRLVIPLRGRATAGQRLRVRAKVHAVGRAAVARSRVITVG